MAVTREDVLETAGRVEHVHETQIQRRDSEAKKIRSAEVTDHPSLGKGPGQRPRMRMAEGELAALCSRRYG